MKKTKNKEIRKNKKKINKLDYKKVFNYIDNQDYY